MSLLEFIIVFSSVFIWLFALDAYKRKKMNLVHFLAFFVGAGAVFVFAFHPGMLDRFWKFFGVARWADLLVYIALIVLAYMFFQLLHSVTKQNMQITKLVSNRAIKEKVNNIDFDNYSSDGKYDEFVFLVRVYNEQSQLKQVLDSILEKGFHKIVLVDDGSKDGSLEILTEYEQSNENIILLSHDINRWPWAANKTGFEFISRYAKDLGVKWVVTFDSDGQMDVEDMDVFIQAMESNPDIDVFLGSRFIKWASTENMPLSRKIAFRTGARWFTKLINGIWICDPHNGYRVMNIGFIKNLKIESDGMWYASELIDNIYRLDANFLEVPVNIKYTDYSLWKGQKLSNAVNIVIETIYKKFFYR